MHTPRPGNPALPEYPAALDLALASLGSIEAVEHVPIAHAAGRVLAEVIRADRDYPPFHRATMDGYALRAADVGRVEAFRVVGMVAAGSAQQPHIESGEAVRIATGAPVPPDADVVIPHELSDRAEPVHFTVAAVKPWDNVHRKGSDAAAEDRLLEPGTRLGASHLGILATVGCTRVPVRRRPRVAVLTSGDEVLPPDAAPVLDHQIRNSGQSMLTMLVETMGGEVGRIAHLPDRQDATDAAVGTALADHDLLVTIGGISAGERDCFHAAFQSAGVEPIVHGAAIQPGKPIYVGRGQHGGRPVCIVGLPGNPVSVLATAHLFLWPIVRVLVGMSPALPWAAVRLSRAAQPNARRQAFRPGQWNRESGQAQVLDWAGSGDLIHTGAADGLIALPMQSEPAPAGSPLRFLPWCWNA